MGLPALKNRLADWSSIGLSKLLDLASRDQLIYIQFSPIFYLLYHMILLCMWWTLMKNAASIIIVIVGTLISFPLLAFGKPNSCILCILKMYATNKI